LASNKTMTTYAPWRLDPGLLGRFHPDYPDDIEVFCHDGEPRRTQVRPEVCWVRVASVAPWIERSVLLIEQYAAAYNAAIRSRPWGNLARVYHGVLLNQPHALTTVRQGGRVAFILAPGLDLPLMVSEAYLVERAHWSVIPCHRCGFYEALDPPSTMWKTRFPDARDAPEDAIAKKSFSAFCPLCGGTQLFKLTPEEAS
jgi:hypothetical protein